VANHRRRHTHDPERPRHAVVLGHRHVLAFDEEVAVVAALLAIIDRANAGDRSSRRCVIEI